MGRLWVQRRVVDRPETEARNRDMVQPGFDMARNRELDLRKPSCLYFVSMRCEALMMKRTRVGDGRDYIGASASPGRNLYVLARQGHLDSNNY
jgi:hypothetical protein